MHNRRPRKDRQHQLLVTMPTWSNVGVAITDICTGLYSFGNIMAALVARAKDGLGQRVDASLLETQVATLANIAGCVANRVRTQRTLHCRHAISIAGITCWLARRLVDWVPPTKVLSRIKVFPRQMVLPHKQQISFESELSLVCWLDGHEQDTWWWGRRTMRRGNVSARRLAAQTGQMTRACAPTFFASSTGFVDLAKRKWPRSLLPRVRPFAGRGCSRVERGARAKVDRFVSAAPWGCASTPPRSGRTHKRIYMHWIVYTTALDSAPLFLLVIAQVANGPINSLQDVFSDPQAPSSVFTHELVAPFLYCVMPSERYDLFVVTDEMPSPPGARSRHGQNDPPQRPRRHQVGGKSWFSHSRSHLSSLSPLRWPWHEISNAPQLTCSLFLRADSSGQRSNSVALQPPSAAPRPCSGSIRTRSWTLTRWFTSYSDIFVA